MSLQGEPNKRRELSEAEIKRLERFERMRATRAKRRKPASVPARLTRTSAFTPKRRGLIQDSSFRRVYVVPGHSVIEVAGRELGSQHRDAIYAVFRLPRTRRTVHGENPLLGSMPMTFEYETRATWRELILAMGRKEHTNNVMTLLSTFEDIKKVVFIIHEGNPEQILASHKKGRLLGDAGKMGNLINDIDWNGVTLDSEVVIKYGSWSVAMLEKAKLVSLNAEVQFALRSDHAKTFWPYIDSMNNSTWIDEKTLAGLAGRDLTDEHETYVTRGQFRKDCKQAFEGMTRAGGLQSWHVEIRGVGRRKSRRFHYVHGLERQMELEI
ncbi:MAG: hypothetical protein K0U74_03185 [Alphaproteobacteria bacterium]|nr:hypothetical protein [Alphaproteobacteria bacterium]